MCRVCHKRPEIPDERFGRCEACVKAKRQAFRFRAVTRRDDSIVIKAGELSPHALGQHWRTALKTHTATPSAKPHLGLHEIEMVVAKDRLESVRVAPDLADRADAVLAALRDASLRSDTSWAV